MVAEVDCIFVVSRPKDSSENLFSTLGMSKMSRTPPQARIDESNRSLDQIRGYGVGGCLFQTVDGVNQPIAFVSKSLTGAQQLKSFLGTVNYCRDIIRNQSSLVHLLHALIADYHKIRKIQWTTEALEAI